MNKSSKHLLIICPSFFGYEKAIQLAAENMGYSVILMDARAGKGVLYKILLKIFPKSTRKLTQGYFKRLFVQTANIEKTDHILFIRGDGMTPETVDLLRSVTPNARMTAYLWDSMRNMPGMMGCFQRADRIMTFDPLDSKEFGWPYIPTFVRETQKLLDKNTQSVPIFDWSFVGSLHSDRHRVLRKLVAIHPEFKSFVHCYVHNIPVKFARAFRDPGILLGYKPPLSYDVLSYSNYQTVIQQSRAIVDIEHPSQTGMTLRTYETLLDGKKLITTNAAVRDSDLYHPSRVAIIDRHQPRIDAAFLDAPFLPIPEETRRSYQIESWLKKVLG